MQRKYSLGVCFSGLVLGLACFTGQAQAACPSYLDHDFKTLRSSKTLNPCEAFPGKALLVVNTASHCGFTPQFKGLEALYQQYKEKGLVVLGFPSDDFFQEDEDSEKTAEICYVNYGVTFPMMAESHVRGNKANPLFQAMSDKVGSPKWNFFKYVLDREGNVVKRFSSKTSPDDESLKEAIEAVL
ncbi:glutathione peroxidase [Marinibactrum halimedae]|uniref:Glutathione peroxidase n=1 Tax=Marinibactrum halimedae TaxID=1444977 RepID=A0AA37TAN1_9GAMM|nr:glutathione peroxidase [Marinibactrum halimedae]MCD9459854.1 glutathione peroxidase [Marinibactrum halimedae]GLS26951.1 glutathione peroxidase [Marinibactrum halimedae]